MNACLTIKGVFLTGLGSKSSWKASLAVVMTHGAEFDRRVILFLFLFKLARRFIKETEFDDVVGMEITASLLLIV